MNENAKLELRVSELLKELAVPVSISGHIYLRKAIIKLVQDFTKAQQIYKVLYGEVARDCNTTISRVERAIRHAIGTSWYKGDELIKVRLFGKLRASGPYPTNGEYITTIADYIIMANNVCNQLDYQLD